MERSTARIAFTVITIGFIVLLGGCMDASLSQSGNAPASISVQDAPSAIPEIDLSITGGGTSISETVGPGTDALVFELPVGEEHEVSIDATNFIGRRSFTLPPGGAQVNVQMLEKLFVPDARNSRMIMIDDTSGANWAVSTVANQTPYFSRPFDIEIGPRGSVFAVHDQGETNPILAFGSIGDTNPDELLAGFDEQAGIAVDHSSDAVYYVGTEGGVGEFVRRVSTAGGLPEDLTSSLLGDLLYYELWGVSVDDQGYVYLSGTEGSDFVYPMVRKVDPDTGTVVWSRTYDGELPVDVSFSDPQVDVVYNYGAVFVTNPSGKSGSKILRLDPQNGDVVDSFGSFPADPDSPSDGELYGPRRFVAVNNRRLTFIDEFSGSSATPGMINYDRLVQTSPGGSDWETYGSSGTGVGQFRFFEYDSY